MNIISGLALSTTTYFKNQWEHTSLSLIFPSPPTFLLDSKLYDMIKSLDSNNDGILSSHEFSSVTETSLKTLQSMRDSIHLPSPESLQHYQNYLTHINNPFSSFQLYSNAWPLLDWKIGIFLFRSMGWFLFIAFLGTVIPGVVSTISARVLRWPVLAITYIQIVAEMIVYFTLRIFIFLLETIFANPTHRNLRKKLFAADSYKEWLCVAKALDKSQGREYWQKTVISDESSARYNWVFIRELMKDLKASRNSGDFNKTIAVLQQCTRKNVGGVMSNELFAFTNSGEGKDVVKEFLNEVVVTIQWITDHCDDDDDDEEDDNVVEVDLDVAAIPGEDLLEVMKSISSPGRNTRSASKKSNAITASSTTADTDTDTYTDTATTPKSKLKSKSKSPGKSPTIKVSRRMLAELFLKRARASYGRTALCLSGGAAMGTYHFGIVKGLFDNEILPHIISGTSAGAVVGAFIGTRTDDEIDRDLKPEVLALHLKSFGKGWLDILGVLWKRGTLFENEYWLQQIQWFAGNGMTFEEAFKKTGRILCITLSATTKKAPPVLLNYVTSPHVVISSAVIASAAVPGFISPMMLHIKDSDGVIRQQNANKDQTYFDGSIEQDIPTSGLAEMFNCQFFLAAQCNPHIIPFFYNNRGDVGKPSRWSHGEAESWRGGFIVSALELYLKTDMKAKFQFLAEIEATIGFTGSLMTQDNWVTKNVEGTTTMVPQISLIDYTQLISDPKLSDLKRYFRGGMIASYEKTALMKSHYLISNTLNECLAKLAEEEGSGDITHEARMNRKKRSGAASSSRRSSENDGSAFVPAGSFNFQSIEEHGEIDYGDSVFRNEGMGSKFRKGRAISPVYNGMRSGELKEAKE